MAEVGNVEPRTGLRELVAQVGEQGLAVGALRDDGEDGLLARLLLRVLVLNFLLPLAGQRGFGGVRALRGGVRAGLN